MIENNTPQILYTIPFDFNIIAKNGWLPNESDISIIGHENYIAAVEDYNKINEKVIFKNTSLVWESDDNTYSLGEWITEINIFNDKIITTIQLDNDNAFIIDNDDREYIFPIKCTIGDFHRWLELLNIQLEFTDYGKLLTR